MRAPFGYMLMVAIAMLSYYGAHAVENPAGRPDGAIELISQKFNRIGSVESPGGLLVRFYHESALLGAAWDSNETGNGIFSDNGFNRAASWTYWRRDLAPARVNFAQVGILVDADPTWELPELLYATDSSSNVRKGCSMYYTHVDNHSLPEEVPSDYVQRFLEKPCVRKAADAAGFSADDVLYWSTSFQAAASTACAADDQPCQSVSAGGCMPWLYWLNYGPWCSDASNPLFDDFAACFAFKKVEDHAYEFHVSGSCVACQRPYMCNLADAPARSDEANPIVYNETAEEFQANVGHDGGQWLQAFPPSGSNNSLPALEVGPELPWKLTSFAEDVRSQNAPFPITQCAFRGKDMSAWSAWVHAQHRIYEKAVSDADIGDPVGKERLKVYENELIMYVEPDTDGRFIRQEDLIFKNVIGVVVRESSSETAALDKTKLRAASFLLDFIHQRTGKHVPLCEATLEDEGSAERLQQMRAALSTGVDLGSFMKCTNRVV